MSEPETGNSQRDEAQAEPESPVLTKRERFAAMAMQGMCSVLWPGVDQYEEIAARAVLVADALIRQLEKPT